MILYISVFLLLISPLLYSQSAEENINWPREIEAGNYSITLYQPQLETLEGNQLDGRMALAVKDKNNKIIFGALWFEARLATDLETRTAVLESLDIPRIKFPDIENEENLDLLKTLIIDDFSTMDIEMSIDNIIANLESVATDNQLDEKLSNKAPSIFFRQEPTVLVSIDGEPILKKTDDGSLEYVVNTPFFIVKKKNTTQIN